MSSAMKIAIGGAGIGGLAAAVLLARDGHEVTVFDQFEKAGPVGSGLILQETGLAVLGRMGLRAEVQALGAPLRRLHGVSSSTGRTVLDVRYSALRASLCGLGVQRPVLFDILYKSARESGASVKPATRIIVANPSTGHLTSGDGITHGPYDIVVDALGVRSPLSSQPRKPLPYGALWATLPWPEHSGFDQAALEQRYFRARQMAGVMPSGYGAGHAGQTLTYFWSIRNDDYPAWRQAPLSHWKDEALALWPETKVLLDQITSHDQLTFATYSHRTHMPVVESRLVHLGDSWHAASPQLGQGANMALLDAFALARALKVESDFERQMKAYVNLRVMHVRLFQMMSWMFTPVYQSDSLVLALLRDWFAAPLSRLPPAPALLAAMVSGAIGSPLKRMGLKPGDHSPLRDLRR